MGEAAVALAQVVRRICCEVGEDAVSAANHPVLVVAEVGRAHPHGVVVVEHVSLGTQSVDRAVNRALAGGGVDRVQVALAEPHVEVHVEPFERRADVAELELVADLAGQWERLVVGEHEQVWPRLEHSGGELGDVAARIAVLGGRESARGGEDRGAEVVHLRARVVDVELGGHGRAGGGEHAGDRVAERRPAGVADVQWAGGVRRHELEVDRLPREFFGAAVGGPGVDDPLREGAGGGGVEREVDEPGTGDIDGRDPLDRAEPFGELGGKLSRGGAHRLGELHGDVGGPVAVIAVPRAIEGQVGGGQRGGDVAGSVGQQFGGGGEQEGGKFGGGHD